jgi:hypothetical protein
MQLSYMVQKMWLYVFFIFVKRFYHKNMILLYFFQWILSLHPIFATCVARIANFMYLRYFFLELFSYETKQRH